MAPGNEINATTRTVARGSVAPEDEDLFDFPLIEMVIEGAPPAAARTVGEITPSTTTTPAAPSAASASSPSSAPAAAPSAQPKAAETPTTAKPSVKEAAELIDGIEEVLDEELETSRLGRRVARRTAPVAVAGSPMAILGGMLMLNLLTFGFFWYTSQNFRDGLEALRDDLVLATNAKQPNTAPERITAPESSSRDTATETVTPPPAAKGDSAQEPVQPAHPLDAFELTTLDLARQEIADGEPIAARKRLHRLLAIADRLEPELAKDVDARARFLVAESYRTQAVTKELRQREAAEADKARATAQPASLETEKAKVD